MKLKHSLAVIALVSFVISCLGDKKMANISELGDTSFVNKNFEGNRINYSKGMSACENLSMQTLADMYSVPLDKLHVEDKAKSDLYDKNLEPTCALYLMTGDNDFEWLRGYITLTREVGKKEFMGDIAEATGNGESWEEAWSFKKATSKSAEWLPDMGMAALWNDSKKQLEVKFEGYTLTVIPLKNSMNAAEVAKNRDYKKIAIAMAKAAGYIN